MTSLHESMIEYKKQMQAGTIPTAYKGLMEYMLDLRTHFQNNHPDYFVSGSIYYGYMDMTYFSFFPESFKQIKLKVAVVFVHQSCSFEVWLAGYNKQVQSKYWQLFKESGWNKYRLVPTIKGVDSILESVLIEAPDFKDLKALTKQIETGTLTFIKDVEGVLATLL